ncbi:MAG: DUF3999 domain-containing protein [Thermoguttaceae bacterium]|jgi:hypothetical protein|nr:DUF3999 domain-containing protein [Thermoguttaceae bacterium]
MRLAQAMLVGLVLTTARLPAAEESPSYRYWRSVERGTSRSEDILAFRLDSDIYAATRPGLPDLRILDDTGAEAPYQIEPEAEFRDERTRSTLDTEVVGLEEKGSSIEIRVRLPENSPPAEGLCIATPMADYERRVRVEGSNDGTNWTLLTSDGVIFDYSRYMDVRNRDVTLPANTFRQFKVTIDEVTDQHESPYTELTRTIQAGKEAQRVEKTTLQRRPLRIDRIQMVYHVVKRQVRQTRKAEYPVAGFDVEQDAEKKQTIVRLRTRREPLARFTLQTPSRNFFRRALVQVPEVVSDKAGLRPDRTEWRDIASVTIFKIQFRDFLREQLSIDFSEQRQETYRLVIVNEDNPPLEIRGVKAEGNVYRVVFLAQEAKPYRVFYGSETAKAPKYEAAAVLASLRQGFQPIEVQLGPQTDNVAFVDQPGPMWLRFLNTWIFLGTAIVLMVVALTWGLVRAGRHVETLPKE